jgi:homocitrate synthase NifV
LLTNPRTYEPFPPESIGRDGRKIVLGKHSGLAAVRNVLQTNGITIEDNQAAALLPFIRAEAQRCKSCPAESIYTALANSIEKL